MRKHRRSLAQEGVAPLAEILALDGLDQPTGGEVSVCGLAVGDKLDDAFGAAGRPLAGGGAFFFSGRLSHRVATSASMETFSVSFIAPSIMGLPDQMA